MNNWLHLKLNYPRLYQEDIPFECGAGWYAIIRNLSEKLEKILMENAQYHAMLESEKDNIPQMYAVQVKEKYGTLRFYMNSETDEMSELIKEAEALSSQTCECCGMLGMIRGYRWYEVRCDNCYKEKK